MDRALNRTLSPVPLPQSRERGLFHVVRQVRRQPALDLADRHVLAGGVVFDLVLGNHVDGEELARQLDAVESQDFAKVDTEIDWVIKRKLFQRYQDRYDMELSDPKIAQLDLAYHDIKRGRGVFDLLQRKGLASRITTDEEIEDAVDQPPQTTRARLRGEFISAAQAAGRDFTVDWVHLKLNDQAQRTVLCKDPFRSVDERVKRLIASM